MYKLNLNYFPAAADLLMYCKIDTSFILFIYEVLI